MTNDNGSSIHSKVPDAPLPVPGPPLSEAFEAVQVSLDGAGDTHALAVVEGATENTAACIRRSNGAVLMCWALVPNEDINWRSMPGHQSRSGAAITLRRSRVNPISPGAYAAKLGRSRRHRLDRE